MTAMNEGAGRVRYRLADHPWVALAIFIVANVLVLGLVGTAFAAAGLRPGGAMHQTVAHIVMLFVLTPLVLGLPKGRRGLVAYQADTGFSRFCPRGVQIRLDLLRLLAVLISRPLHIAQVPQSAQDEGCQLERVRSP